MIRSIGLAALAVTFLAVPTAYAMQGKASDGRKAMTLEQMQERQARHFARLDADGDGMISKAEMMAPHERRMAKLFERTDTDKDGAISKAERATATERMFKALDRDGDGVISAEERRRWGETHRSKTAQ